MFRALMGGRSSDSRSTTSNSKSSSRRRTNSKASSTVSRKSSRGDDRDRGLGDLSAYSSSGSRSKRYAPSAAGDSVASSYATAEPGISVEHDRIIIERTPKRRDTDEESGRDRYSDIRDRDGRSSRRRDRDRSQSRERERPRSERIERAQLEDDAVESRDRRRERSRTQSGDTYLPPVSTSMPIQPNSPLVYDPHVQQQFPGQFPAYVAEPYRPPNPAGEAADYYGDQGQSVADQPGVRPKPPSIIPNSQAHLMTASPVANPPPEPSSMGQVGAAAAYFADDPELAVDPAPGRPDRPTAGTTSKPPKPSNATFGISGMAAGAAAYGAGSSFPLPASPISPPEPVPTTAPYAPPVTSNTTKPPHAHGIGASVGAAAAGAAAGYMLGHHQHHSMSSTDHLSQYTMQNYDESSQHGFGIPGPTVHNVPANPGWHAAGTGAAVPYAASPLHPHHAAVHHGAPFPSGSLAFQQRQRGPLDKFIDFWRDPEGVGMFEEYTEAIGVCKYCFEPGTSSRDAPRKHHYRPRRSSGERYVGGSRVGKASRYTSSEDEGRRRKKSSRSSWLLPGLLGGIAAKALFNNKDFEDTYSVRSGRVMTVNDTESVSTTRRSQTSRGVYRRRSPSRDRESRIIYSDSKSQYEDDKRHRSRSRSHSSSRIGRHSALRDAAVGAAVGSGALALAKSRDRSRSRSRSRSPRKSKGRKSSTSGSSSFLDISQPARKSVGGGIASFFTASSDNRGKRRVKKRRSIFSFNNSSSSSLDADLAFGTGFARKPARKSDKKSSKKKDRDVDAALLGLGAAATALAATSHRRSRRAGEILAAKETRSRHSDYASSVTNDEGWEDLDSGDQSSSSVSSALAFGDTGLFGSDESQSSDSGTSKWGWRWGSKKNKKKKKRASSPQDKFPTGAALAAGALGTAALASTQDRDSRLPRQPASSSSGSLQHVAPVPTSDPTLVDAVRVASLPHAEPAFVRPGPIPLQQPQPMTPVSQAVYATQGESIPAYAAPMIPPAFPPASYIPYRPEQIQNVALGFNRPHHRSDSSPVFHTEPLEGVPAPGLKRRSTVKDQSSVQFDLTKEQADKERRADRLEQLKRDVERASGVQLIDREYEPTVRDDDRRSGRYEDRGYDDRRQDEPREDRYAMDSGKGKDSFSRVGAVAAGAIGAAAAATVLSGRSSVDESSETSQRRHEERRQQRRAERRRGSEPESTVSSRSNSEPVHETNDHLPEERQPEPTKPPSPSRSPHKYDDYAEFFAPEELRYSPDTYKRRAPTSMPTIVEIEPASERQSREALLPAEESHPGYRDLPWPVPVLKLIEPTPPQSLSGSVRDAASPVGNPRDLPPHEEEEDVKPAARQTTGSRVSWGEHETHEYEVPSTSSELESVDHETTRERQYPHSPVLQQRDVSPKNVADDVGADIEFAAALAAATAAAGFDPALVTEDPTYHTRSSPPGSHGGVEYRDPWVETESESRIPHGFVEGEVETPEDEKAPSNRVVEEQPLYSEPEPVSREPDNQDSSEPQTRTSIPQEVIDRLSEKQDERDGSRKAPCDTEKSPISGKERDESEVPAQDSFSMPGGFETEESRSESKRDVDSRDDGDVDRRSVASAPVSGEYDSSTRPRKFTQDSGYFDDGEDAASAPVEQDGSEGKKKRRKRRSKRDSDTFTDSASVTSSPARMGQSSEKLKSMDDKDKEKKAGGFFSSIFGSRVSEPVDSKRSSSADRPSSRDVHSEVGRREYEESRRRRKEEKSSRRDEESGSDKENSKARDKDGIDIENYKSSRQRREERRRRRYEDIVDSGRPGEYEKDRKISEDNDENQPFLAEGPEMPAQIGDGDRESGASGRVRLAEGAVTGLGIAVQERRPRGRSTPPEASERIMDPAPRSRSRPASPEPDRQEGDNQSQSSRRSSILRSKDSPTAVPLHFRRPPVSPGTNRSVSVGTPTAPSPGSPTAPKRRPNSTEFKNSREIRPLWLVERHGPGHGEHEPEELLPSLPSSKTSSANTSVEDLTALQDERSWEAVDLSHHVHVPRRLSGIDVSQSRGFEHDALGSQQVTPTATTFEQIHPHPSSRKEKLKYEFHSPSELLQDPSPYGDVQTFDMGDLPSAEGSAVGVKDASAENEDNVELAPEALPSRPSTPQNNITAASEDTETTPTQTRTVNAFEGPGFAGVVDAAVAAAVSGCLSTQPDVAISDKEGPVDLPYDADRTDKSIADHELATTSFPAPGAPLDFAAVVDAAVAAAAGSIGGQPEAAKIEQSPKISEPIPQTPHPDEQETSHPTGNDDSVPRDDKRRDSVDTVVPLAEEASDEKEKLDASAVIPDLTGENKELPSETKIENANDNDQAQTEQPPVDTDEPSSSSAKKKKKKNKKKRQSMDSSTQEPTTPVDDSTVDQGEAGISTVEDARTDAVETSEPAPKEQVLAEQPAGAEPTPAPEQEPTEATVAVEKATEAPDVSKALEEEPAPAAPEDTPAESTAETPAEDQAETSSSKKSKKKKKKKNKGSAPEDNTEDPTSTETPEASAATSRVIAEEQVEPTVETTQPAEGEPKPTEESTIAVAENTVEPEPVPKEMEAPEDPTFHDIPIPGESQGSPVEADNQAKELPHSREEFQAEATRAQELPENTEITNKTDDLSSGIDPSGQAGSDMVNETASPEVWHDALASSPEDKSAETEQADLMSDAPQNEEKAPVSEIQALDKELSEISEKPAEVDTPAVTHVVDSPSTDQVETADSGVQNEEPTPTTTESETPLSRKNSKKNKKKNKRKNTAETPVQNEAVDPAEPISSVEGVPEPGPEATTTAVEEPRVTLPDEAVDENKGEARDVQAVKEEPLPENTAEIANESQPTTVEENHQTEAEQSAPDVLAEIMSESQPAAPQDVLNTAPEEPVDEQPKKERKKKKNRKSVNVSESLPESELVAKTEELRSVEPVETPQPQISGEVAGHSQVPAESSVSEVPAGIEEVAPIPAAEAVELNLPVEKDEANGGEPHVTEPSEQPNNETVPGPELDPEPVPEAGEIAPSGKKSKKNKNKKQSLSFAPDETPVCESSTPADAADGNADLPVASQDSSLKTDQEPMREEPTASQPIVESVAETPDLNMAEKAVPMTAAQKKKAKKEKKKKRQSALLDEPPASESIEEADAEDVTSGGAQMPPEVLSEPQSSEPTLDATEHAEATAKHSQEQAKEDVALHTDRSPNSDGEFVLVPEHVPYGSNGENTPQSGSMEFDVTQVNSELEKQPSTQEGVLDANEATPAETPSAADQPVQEESSPTPAMEGGAAVEELEAAEKDIPEGFPDKTIEHNDTPDDSLTAKEAETEVVSDQGDAVLDVEAGSEGLIRDDQPSASSKKKDKKKKKKRQSLTLDDKESPSTKEELTAEASSDRVPESSAVDESAPIPSASEEQQKPETDVTETVTETAAEPAPPSASEEPENIAEAPSNEATQEPAAEETRTAESTEEAQTAKSKKKAKKDKKKRKSVSFEIGEPSTQQSEPGHPTATSGETVTPLEDPKPEGGPTSQKDPSEEFQPGEAVPETTQDGADIVTQPEQPEPTAEATEVIEQHKQVTEPSPGSLTEEQAVVEETAAPPVVDEASQLQEQKVSSEALWSETQEDGVKSAQDAESLNEKKGEPAVSPSLEDNEGTKPEALAEQAEFEPQTPIDDGEQGVGPSKSKKNKKKKKRTTLESTEDVPVTPPEPSNVELLESTPVLETEKAHDIAEPDTTVSEIVHEAEKPEEESGGFLSAKAKKKAKKDKKRQSKILDSANDATNTAEIAPDISEQAPLDTPSGEADGPDVNFSQETSEAVSTEAKFSEPSPETALTPAEDDGKENQSHDTEPHGGNDKDLTWTDHMVSSQVEQQQATPSDRPSQPALETEPISTREAATSIDVEQLENNADDASPAVDDGLERSGEEGTRVKNEIVSEKPEMRYEGLLEIPREEMAEISSQGEDTIQVKSDAQVEESVKATVEGTAEDSMSREHAPESVPDGGDATTKDQFTDIEVNDPSKSEDILEPENEELPLPISGKKKKKDKKKKKAQQETKIDETLQDDLVDAVQEESPTSRKMTDTALPVAESQADPVAEPSHELPEPQKAVETAVEDKNMEETLEVKQDVTPAEDVFQDAPALSRKKSKKDKKRERLAQKAALEPRENESKEEQLATEEHLIPPSDAQTTELASPVYTQALETPTETTVDAGERELHSSAVQSPVPVEDNIKAIETSGAQTVESFRTLEAPEQPLERNILLNDYAATAPEELPAVEKSAADETATEPIIEEAALSRKNSKKKAKKAKKQAQEQQERNATPTPAEPGEDSIAETTTAIPSTPGPAENSGDGPEANVSEEQVTQLEHSEQLVPSGAARPQETLEQTPNMDNQTDNVLSMEQEKEGTFQAEPSQDLDIRNEPEDPIESQPEPTAAVARKSSKKEKRKAKKKSAKDAIEPSDEPELRNPTESIGASVSTADQAKTDQDQFLTVASDKQMVEEVPQPLEVEPGATEVHQGAADENDWPAIDWEKGKVEIKEQTPLSSPEAHAVPFEPAIAEFDETAIPEGLLRRQSLSREEQLAGGKDGSSQHTGADETKAAPQEGAAMIEPSAVAETEQSAGLKAESVSSQVAPKTLQEDVQHPENRLARDQAKSATEVVPSKQSKVGSIFPNLERGSFRRPAPGQVLMPVKDRAEDETIDQNADDNSAIKVSEAPIPAGEPEESHLQGQQDAKGLEPTTTVSTRDLSLEEPTKMQDTSSTPVNLAVDVEVDPSYNVSVISDGLGNESKSIEIEWKDDGDKRTQEVETPLYAPLPVHEQKSSLVSQTSPVDMDRDERIPRNDSSCGLRRSPSIHGRHNHPPRTWSLEDPPITKTVTPPLFGGPAGATADMSSPPRTPLQPIAEQEPEVRVEQASGFRSMVSEHGTPRLEMKPEHVLPRPETPIRKFTDNALARQTWPVADNDMFKSSEDEDAALVVKKRRPGNKWPAEVLKTPDQGMPILRPSSVSSIKSVQSNHSVTGGQRSLRRTSRNTSGDLRAASQAQESHSPQPHATPQPPQPPPSDLNIERIASSSSYDPVTDKGKRPIRAMTDVYEGWGETPSSPRSPSRPPSIRHRRSMQHLQELETRLDQLISENRLLIAAREAAEDKLRNASVARRKSDHTLNERSADLRDREAEVENLKNSVEWLQKEVTRLTEENEGLATTNSNLTAAHAKEIESVRESSSRQLDDLRSRYEQLSMEVQNTVRHEIETALARKDNELRRLREELETARDKVSQLQQQIAASLHDNVLIFRDEDYFDAACQKLCGHVQQWVLRFSKHSDHRRCRKLAEIQDEKIADRFDNAILDGYDTDTYLADRVRRRDVFMSVVMTMVWEFVFTRYLFGMDREQRQKLKSLEKQLSEVGPRSAVHRWRAITLTLLSKRPAFARQRESDTEAVALEIFETLSRLLPPPSHVEAQLLESLRKVLRVAVNLSIEMRTQLAEYIMLPPLQPEYDTNGDLARQVYFNASLMNERSGETTSNEELESQQAVVRVVLFPLVVKKGNDTGEGEDEVVVCPAQVLVARPDKDPRASKIFSSDRMSLDGTKSVHSVAPSSTMDISNVI
ncbi:involucrin repeat protein [Aspergillus fischeri NRRL 181]|uniref:Involucrin repeat protein, putative n=1 Tax=Neosartorya fischeri (strain ATCC 1020 / DSM 3700 / CBS 544.65 / FGSC A1164 / JCM 1740 / NRRL 181 / WB 181) TaxID=331117 RepID=A1DGB2_NEOFI|nr:involucrin repeat protein, putative [Aspergillus fischeri NRRL 181]EAW18419.1 involucrin repeat protein, putative [Aspergillus fischeri NRRL 181]